MDQPRSALRGCNWATRAGFTLVELLVVFMTPIALAEDSIPTSRPVFDTNLISADAIRAVRQATLKGMQSNIDDMRKQIRELPLQSAEREEMAEAIRELERHRLEAQRAPDSEIAEAIVAEQKREWEHQQQEAAEKEYQARKQGLADAQWSDIAGNLDAEANEQMARAISNYIARCEEATNKSLAAVRSRNANGPDVLEQGLRNGIEELSDSLPRFDGLPTDQAIFILSRAEQLNHSLVQCSTYNIIVSTSRSDPGPLRDMLAMYARSVESYTKELIQISDSLRQKATSLRAESPN